MPVEPEVLAEAKAAIGLTSPVHRSEITRKDFRRFSIATGDKNSLWRDDDYAKEAGYEGIVAPALFYTTFNLPDDDLDQLDHTGLGNNMGPRFEVPARGFPGAVTGGRELEYGVPMCPGDTSGNIRAERLAPRCATSNALEAAHASNTRSPAFAGRDGPSRSETARRPRA